MNVQYFFRDCSPALHFTPTLRRGARCNRVYVQSGVAFGRACYLQDAEPLLLNLMGVNIPIFHRDKTDSRTDLAKLPEPSFPNKKKNDATFPISSE
jgi:hypothetical protein